MTLHHQLTCANEPDGAEVGGLDRLGQLLDGEAGGEIDDDGFGQVGWVGRQEGIEEQEFGSGGPQCIGSMVLDEHRVGLIRCFDSAQVRGAKPGGETSAMVGAGQQGSILCGGLAGGGLEEAAGEIAGRG